MPPPKGSFNPLEGPGDYTTTKEVHSDTYSAIDPRAADLSGKSVLVVGATKGIGRAIAISFGRAGASEIAVAARSDLSSTADEVRRAALEAGRAEPRVLALKLDVTDTASVDAGARRIEEEFGKLDVVVHNAAVLAGRGMMAETDPEDWWQTITVNLKGPYLVARACVPLLLRGETKTLITVSSVGAFICNTNGSAYQISKTAATRLMQFAGREYGEQGIVALSVHPGNVLTDMVGRGESMDEKFKAVFTETPELCADTLSFLCRERRAWLNGRYVNCTWDMPELMSAETRRKIEEGDLLKVRLSLP